MLNRITQIITRTGKIANINNKVRYMNNNNNTNRDTFYDNSNLYFSIINSLIALGIYYNSREAVKILKENNEYMESNHNK